MEQEENKNAFSIAASWFARWMLNNKAVSVLSIILLILVNWLVGKRIVAYSRKQKS